MKQAPLFILSCVLLIFTFSAIGQQSSADGPSKVNYDKGMACADRSLDSILYFVELIKRTSSQSAAKNFYYYSLKCTYAYKAGFLEEQKENAEESMRWAIASGDDQLLVGAYENKAICFMEMNVADSTEHYFQLAINKTMQINDEESLHRLLINYSNLLIEQGRKDEALAYAFSSISYDSLYNNNARQGHNYHLLGNVYLHSGDYSEALDAFLVALRVYEEQGNVIRQVKILNNIGLVQTAIGELDAAEKTYLESLDLIAKNNLINEKVTALINLGAVYLEKGDTEGNRKLLLEALEISEKYHHLEYAGQIQNNLGNVAYYEGDYQGALDYFQKGLAISIQTHNRQEEALCYSNTGWAYLVLNKEKECFEAFQKAYSIGVEIKSGEKRMMALEGLADASEYFGNYKDALAYKNRFVALKDSVLGEKMRSKIAGLEALYDKEKRENEIEDLKQKEELTTLELRENDLVISRLNWQRVVLALAFIMLLLLAFFGYRLYNNKKEREKAKALIDERERGLKAVFDATEEERQRIAKDLHDGIGQRLSGLKLAWSKFSGDLKKEDPAKGQKLDQLSAVLDESATELRELSHQMMPRVLIEMGLIPALKDMLEKSLGLGEIEYVFDHYNLDERLNERLELTFFRVTQELINNVVKHSGAKKVDVQLFKSKDHVVLIIEDNGKGLEENFSGSGHGFTNIRSRLDVVNGTFNLEPSLSAGTLATIRVSLI